MVIVQSLVRVLTGLILVALIQACGTTLQPTASSGLVMYTEGARQHNAMLQVALPPGEVYEGMLRVLNRRTDLELINRDEKRLLVEVEKGGMLVTGQATDLGHGETLLFIWADAGNSGQTGASLTKTAIREICTELAVKCEVKPY